MKTNLIEGVDFYYNEQGYMVLTEQYHLDRGYCCGNGCRHCPFDFDCVPEPKRSELRENMMQRQALAGIAALAVE